MPYPNCNLPCKSTRALDLTSSSILTQSRFGSAAPQGLPASLKNLYSTMSKTTDAVTPAPFLNALRQAFPQFAEMSRQGGAMKSLGGAMYAQQGLQLTG